MRPSKNENEVASIGKATTKYVFVAPGVIGKGRGRGLKSLSSLGVSRIDIPFFPSTDQAMKYNQIVETGAVTKGRGRGLRFMCSLGVSEMGPTNKKPLVFEKGHMQTNIPSFSSTDNIMHYIQKNSASALGKGRKQELRSMCSLEESENEERSFHQNTHYNCQSMSRPSKSTLSAAQELRTVNKNPLVHDKENMQTDISFSPSVDQVMQSPQKAEASILGKGRGRVRSMCSFEESENEVRSFYPNSHYASQNMSRHSKSTRLDSTMYAAQGLRTMNQKLLFHDKENMQTDISFSPSIDQVMQSTQTVETSTAGKVKKVRGSNKCKEVASLEVGEKLKVTFYNNRTVGKNNNLFSRHLGKIVCDRNIYPLGILSWDRIKEEKLNHMWAAVKDKFESDDMDIHRDHILGWMKELWNK
uniref:Uncharacterized protein isoform X2 n=1 Tax=Nicotiana tabacum TaxID=4097 RepID=A0A1S4A9W1_TOBAC|nr:PREDICTED: uncharacterized protein LOC107795295 isoform X2 [Nicotiana tabacum]